MCLNIYLTSRLECPECHAARTAGPVPGSPSKGGLQTLLSASPFAIKLAPSARAKGEMHGHADHLLSLGIHPHLDAKPACDRRDDRPLRDRAGRAIPTP